MNRINRIIPVLILALLIAATAIAQGDDAMLTERSTGKMFPRALTIDVDGNSFDLSLTGLAVRKKLVFKVYAIAHYRESEKFSSEDEAYAAVIGGAKAKRIVMDFARGVDHEKIQNAYREGFEKNATEEEQAEVGRHLEKFLSYYADDVAEHEQFIIDYAPGGTIHVINKGKSFDPIVSEAFATVLWRIWLGEDSIVDRDKLVALVVPEKVNRRKPRT